MVKPNVSVKKALAQWLLNAERVVVAGVGNPIRRDDYVGVEVVRALAGKISEKILLVECETVPESFLQQIIDFNPTHVLLVDAALLGLKPGSCKLVDSEELTAYPAVSTHALPLRLFCQHLIEATETKIALLLIEPGSSEFGEGLTPNLQESARQITAALIAVLP